MHSHLLWLDYHVQYKKLYCTEVGYGFCQQAKQRFICGSTVVTGRWTEQIDCNNGTTN